tara:strand:- start:4395 stop:4541 length:147 start_codon:yes stop_codon:yes gene_type:complete
MAKVEYKKILKTVSKPDSKVQKELDRKLRIAIEIVMIQDKKLLEMLAR